jgi:hypothetical protein
MIPSKDGFFWRAASTLRPNWSHQMAKAAELLDIHSRAQQHAAAVDRQRGISQLFLTLLAIAMVHATR